MEAVTYRRDVGGWQVRWNAERAARAVAEGDWPNRTVADYALERNAEAPERPLLIDDELPLTAGALYEDALRLGGWFVAIGLRAGDVISFQLPNWWEAAVINIAAAMTGVVVNPIVPINRDAELTYMLGTARSRVVFIPSIFRKYDYAAMLRRVLPDLEALPRVVVVRGCADGFESFEAILQLASPLHAPPAVDPDAVKLLMYTSGTTGRPKGVLHTHNTINADAVKMKPSMALTARDVTFSPSPITHVSGYLWSLNMPWYGNIPTVMVDVWEPVHAFELLQRHRCSFALGATPFLRDLIKVARERGETLEHLRYYLCGGASVPPSLIYEAAELFPNCVPWRNFGATEVPTMTRGPQSRAELKMGAETDGKLYRADVKVLDAVTGIAVAPGEEGEVLVREPSMAVGYAQSEDNQGAYDEEGFFRMGDLVRVTLDGLITCTGRKKDLIIRAGENISAKEIEDVLVLSATVAEVAVVSMPSDKTGEAICAFIVPADAEGPSFAEVSEMIRHAGLARQKTPEHVEIVPELPKTAAGKILKDVLRKRAAGYVRN